MLDFIKKLTEKIGDLASYVESTTEIHAKIDTKIEALPNKEELSEIIKSARSSDDVKLSFQSLLEKSYECSLINLPSEDYQCFLGEHENSDPVSIDIHVKKSCTPIAFYDYNKLLDSLQGKSVVEQLVWFDSLFRYNQDYLAIDLPDNTCRIKTHNIEIGVDAYSHTSTRAKLLKQYDDASLFFNKNNYLLIPDDFRIIESENCPVLVRIFKKIETVLSVIYIANTAQLTNDQLVVNLKPEQQLCFDINQIDQNQIICDIGQWIFGNSNPVERAGIARNILSIYCRNETELLNISQSVVDAIKSNFVIYQRNNTEEYIETKNKIADSIDAMIKAQQEMTKDIVDGFRNNFIAVVTFLITAILSGMNIDDIEKSGLTGNMKFVSILFWLASVAYLIMCVLGVIFKLSYLKEEYTSLQKNYLKVLDKKDLEDTFGNVYQKSRERVWHYISAMGTIWVLFVILLGYVIVRFGGLQIKIGEVVILIDNIQHKALLKY